MELARTRGEKITGRAKTKPGKRSVEEYGQQASSTAQLLKKDGDDSKRQN